MLTLNLIFSLGVTVFSFTAWGVILFSAPQPTFGIRVHWCAFVLLHEMNALIESLWSKRALSLTKVSVGVAVPNEPFANHADPVNSTSVRNAPVKFS